jgi:hypothetical protein
MKKINNFFDRAPLWQIYIFGVVFTGGFTFCLFKFIPSADSINPLTTIIYIKIGLILGLIFGLMITLMTSMMRKSTKFWDLSKILEDKIDLSETKKSLDDIYNNDFQILKELGQGRPHYDEIRRLYTIMKTKYKYVS